MVPGQFKITFRNVFKFPTVLIAEMGASPVFQAIALIARQPNLKRKNKKCEFALKIGRGRVRGR